MTTADALVSPPCNLCGADDYAIVHETVPIGGEGDGSAKFSASSAILGKERIVRCRRCDLVYINPRVAESAILEAYAGSVEENYVSESEGRYITFQADARLLERWAPAKGRLLDVGAAAGLFVKAAKEAGWDAVGVEPCRWLADYARSKLGLDVRTATLLEARLPEASFDAVTMWDVLEHLADPSAELREAARIIKPGGLLLINFPDFSSVLARLAGRRWWFLLSMHLYYFTPATLKKMLEQAGFSALGVMPHYQRLSLGYLLTRLEPYCGPLARALQPLARLLGLSRRQIPYYASQTKIIARKAPARERR